MEKKYKIKYIQVTETTHTISRFPIQVPSLHLSPEEVTNIILDSKTSKITSPNSLPQKIIKQIEKLYPFHFHNSELINKFFAQGIFPLAFKTPKIVPIFKSKSRLLCNNYRPIFLLSNVIKIIEKLMHKRLNELLEQETCLYSLKCGLRLNCSTNNALMSIIENTQN